MGTSRVLFADDYIYEWRCQCLRFRTVSALVLEQLILVEQKQSQARMEE
jgi:hypothetical protein